MSAWTARQVVIENAIPDSPCEEPTRHFRFDDNDITDELDEERRVSLYVIPIPVSKVKGKGKAAQLALAMALWRAMAAGGRRVLLPFCYPAVWAAVHGLRFRS
jgi:hypothetical protein